MLHLFQDAHDSFNDWFKHFHHARPHKPDVAQGANFTERVAYEHKLKDYEQELDRWQHSLNLQSKVSYPIIAKFASKMPPVVSDIDCDSDHDH